MECTPAAARSASAVPARAASVVISSCSVSEHDITILWDCLAGGCLFGLHDKKAGNEGRLESCFAQRVVKGSIQHIAERTCYCHRF